MTLTRWKLMAGVLGLSLGGLAAVAESPKPTVPANPKPVANLSTELCPIPNPAPLTIPAPPVAQFAPPVAPSIPGPLTIPMAEAARPVVSTPGDLPALPVPTESLIPITVVSTSAKPVEIAPMPRKVIEQVVELTVPMTAVEPRFTQPQPQPVVTQVSNPVPVPVAAPIPAPPIATPAIAPSVPQQPRLRIESEEAFAPTPVAAQPTLTPSAPQPASPSTPAIQPVAPFAATEKKLRIVLNMGDDRPRFEVRDGEDALLKVTSERVDVKSPSERGEPMSTLRAVGGVKFITPGGEGYCDELSVVPGTGQVVVSGKVRFTYNWGKVETEVSSDRMTFRLGAAPGVTSANTTAPTTPTAVPASYQRTR